MSEDNERGTGFPQILHDRARGAGTELRRLLISLSTGALGVYFLALTTRPDPALSVWQQAMVIVGLVAMASALGAGLLGWYSDCRRNYFWATALQANAANERDRLYKLRDFWLAIETWMHILIRILFAVGVGASAAYVCLRVIGK